MSRLWYVKTVKELTKIKWFRVQHSSVALNCLKNDASKVRLIFMKSDLNSGCSEEDDQI